VVNLPPEPELKRLFISTSDWNGESFEAILDSQPNVKMYVHDKAIYMACVVCGGPIHYVYVRNTSFWQCQSQRCVALQVLAGEGKEVKTR